MTKLFIIAGTTIGLLAFGYQYSNSSKVRAALPAQPASATVAHHFDPVELVRTGSLPDFPSTTVGKAFENRFQNVRWISFDTPNGTTIVDFSGVVQSDVLSKAGLNVDRENPIILRSNCIASLGLKAKMEEETKSAQASERAASQTIAKEDLAAIKLRRKQVESETELSNANEAIIETCIRNQGIPVKFQFKVFADKKTFELLYIDHMPFGETAPGRVLMFVYQP
jgi:hypothetical protein